MKTKVIIFLLLIFCLYSLESYTQESCKVLKQEIAKSYIGKCKKGLANGKGVAEGIDRYEGTFKNGLPHGKGMYTWATGEIYDGNWKNGKKEGEGKLYYKKNGGDSIKVGVWKDDVYDKKIMLKTYRVITARDLDRYVVQRVGEGDEVSLTMKKMGSSNGDVSDFNFTADNGLYKEQGRRFSYYQLIFPVTLKINFVTTNKLRTLPLNVVFEVTLNEPGKWEIILYN